MTFQQLINYYASLLILEYLGKARAYATIQRTVTSVIMGQYANTIQVFTFSSIPFSGSFVINYGSASTAPIQWNATNAQIFSAVAAIIPSSSTALYQMTGGLSTGVLTFIFLNLCQPLFLTVTDNILNTEEIETEGGVVLETEDGDILITE